MANDSRAEELAVQKLLLTGGQNGRAYCSAVMIGPQWALTAAHCLTGADGSPRGIQFYRAGHVGPTIQVDKFWLSQYYDTLGNLNWKWHSINIRYQDFAVLHLHSPAPHWVTFADIAQPNEVYTSEPAETVGFPYDKFKGKTKVIAGDCDVRQLAVDTIFSDCATSEGSSGGALYVFTKAKKWKLAGIVSNEFILGATSDHKEDDVQGGFYSDSIANQFNDITYYSGEIANIIKKYDGETLLTLRASLTYPVQCLTRLTTATPSFLVHFWRPLNSCYFAACKAVQTQSQLNELFSPSWPVNCKRTVQQKG